MAGELLLSFLVEELVELSIIDDLLSAQGHVIHF
jgi:hypothetical protein